MKFFFVTLVLVSAFASTSSFAASGGECDIDNGKFCWWGRFTCGDTGEYILCHGRGQTTEGAWRDAEGQAEHYCGTTAAHRDGSFYNAESFEYDCHNIELSAH